MADELFDAQFWLPAHFLTHDDIIMDCQTQTNSNSPVESLFGSSESDEDEFVSGITRKLAQSSIQRPKSNNSKSWGLEGSPQSTLTSVLGGSSKGSTNCSSQVSSPPSNRQDVSWDLLYKAAGEVAKMRRHEDLGGYKAPLKNPNYNPNESRPFNQFQSTPVSNWGQSGIRPGGLSQSAWPTLQQSRQPGGDMRAVYLGIPGAKTGTGVFIPNMPAPRRTGVTPAASRKKQGCSTVLVPERVVQALNLKLQPINSSVLDPSLKNRKCVPAVVQQRQNIRRPEAAEIRLPQEWTY